MRSLRGITELASIAFEEVRIDRYSPDGRIVEIWFMADSLTLYQGVGLVQPACAELIRGDAGVWAAGDGASAPIRQPDQAEHRSGLRFEDRVRAYI